MTFSSLVAAVVLLLALSCSGAVQGGFIEDGKLYYIILKGGRSSCSTEAQFLGFYNRTCGGDVGPALRSATTAKTWRQWKMTKTGEDADGNDLVYIDTYYKSGVKARCVGKMTTAPGSECTNEASSKPIISPDRKTTWRIVPVTGDGSYQILVHYTRNAEQGTCNRYLGAQKSCSDAAVGLTTGDDGSKLQRWLIEEIGASPGPAPITPSPVTPVPSSPVVGAPSPVPPVPKSPAPNSPVPSPTPSPATVAGQPATIVATSAGGPTTGTVIFAPAPNASSCIVTLMPGNINDTVNTITAPTSVASFTDLTPDTTYTATVGCAVSGGAESPVSNEQKLVTPAINQPAIANARPLTSNSLGFTVVPPESTNGIVSYQITYGVAGSINTRSMTITPSQLDVTLTNLVTNNVYQVTCVGLDSSGQPITPVSPPVFVQLVFSIDTLVVPGGSSDGSNQCPGEGQIPNGAGGCMCDTANGYELTADGSECSNGPPGGPPGPVCSTDCRGASSHFNGQYAYQQGSIPCDNFRNDHLMAEDLPFNEYSEMRGLLSDLIYKIDAYNTDYYLIITNDANGVVACGQSPLEFQVPVDGDYRVHLTHATSPVGTCSAGTSSLGTAAVSIACKAPCATDCRAATIHSNGQGTYTHGTSPSCSDPFLVAEVKNVNEYTELLNLPADLRYKLETFPGDYYWIITNDANDVVACGPSPLEFTIDVAGNYRAHLTTTTAPVGTCAASATTPNFTAAMFSCAPIGC